jgi:S1-C subfamily serine protease
VIKPCSVFSLLLCSTELLLGQSLFHARPNLSQLIDKTRPSVVQVVSYFGVQRESNKEHGTGFFVDSNGIVVTAKHVISHGPSVPCDTSPLKPLQPFRPLPFPPRLPDLSKPEDKPIQASTIWIAWPQESQHVGNVTIINNFRQVRARVSSCDDKHDIAILEPEQNPLTFSDTKGVPFIKTPTSSIFLKSQKRASATLGSKAFRDGDPIFTSGYPLSNNTLITTSGYIASSAPVGIDETTGKFEDVYWADIHINPGNSGGPAFSLENGTVIGIVLAVQLAPTNFNEAGAPQAYTLERAQQNQNQVIQRYIVANAGIAEIIPIEFARRLLRTNIPLTRH